MRRDWSINGRFLTQKITGVQRYAREIVSAIDTLIGNEHPLAHGLDLRLLVPSSYQGALPALRSIRIRRVGRLNGHLWEQLELPLHARGGLLNLCNTGPLIRPKQIVCIHDLNPLLFPASYSPSFRLGYSILLPMLGRTAARVSTVSEFSARLLVERGITGGRSPVIACNGHEHVNRWTHQSSERPAVRSNTVIVLGSLALHKNTSIVLNLAQRLAAHGINIAVVGRRDPRVFSQQASRCDQQSGILWLGALTDDELAGLMQDSLCLAFPSLMEGFGLPPLEAMALGCPVVVSNCASLPEVCGDAALYASPTDPDDWINCFMTLRDNPRLRRDMIAKGRARAGRFSWGRSAEIYLQALAQLDGIPSIDDQPIASSAGPSIAAAEPELRLEHH
jgi:glycosyltransferase involved in cell wall biosynthesis